MIKEKTFSEIFDKDFKDYAMYVLQSRALPSAIDGQKIVGRKLLFAMLKNHKSGKVKVAEIAGSLSSVDYAHGEMSAAAAAINMAAPYQNLCAIFEPHGNFGSRLVQEPAGPRYVSVSLSESYKRYFADEEIVPKNSSNDAPEPAHYLPVIPWALVNGSSGIAVGFKHDVLSRSIKDVTDAVNAYLKNPTKFMAETTPILPTFPSFKGTVIHVGANKYSTIGKVDYIGKYTYAITELPVGYERSSYVQILADMEESGLIKGFSDECSKSGFCFHVKVSVTSRELIDKDPIKFFKLAKNHTEHWNLIGIDGKLVQFSGPRELVKYFVDYRITKCGEKIAWEIGNETQKLKQLNLRKQFVKAIIDGELTPVKMKKSELEDWITKNIADDADALKLASIPMYSCTTDEVHKMQSEIMVQYEKIDVLMKTSAESRYNEMLKKLKV